MGRVCFSWLRCCQRACGPERRLWRCASKGRKPSRPRRDDSASVEGLSLGASGPWSPMSSPAQCATPPIYWYSRLYTRYIIFSNRDTNAGEKIYRPIANAIRPRAPMIRRGRGGWITNHTQHRATDFQCLAKRWLHSRYCWLACAACVEVNARDWLRHYTARI